MNEDSASRLRLCVIRCPGPDKDFHKATMRKERLLPVRSPGAREGQRGFWDTSRPASLRPKPIANLAARTSSSPLPLPALSPPSPTHTSARPLQWPSFRCPKPAQDSHAPVQRKSTGSKAHSLPATGRLLPRETACCGCNFVLRAASRFLRQKKPIASHHGAVTLVARVAVTAVRRLHIFCR